MEPAGLGPPDRADPPRPAPAGRQPAAQQRAFEGGPQVPEESLYRVVDALETVSQQTGKTIPQIALNWLLGRPTIASIIIGARNETQLLENIDAVGWHLSPRAGSLTG